MSGRGLGHTGGTLARSKSWSGCRRHQRERSRSSCSANPSGPDAPAAYTASFSSLSRERRGSAFGEVAVPVAAGRGREPCRCDRAELVRILEVLAVQPDHVLAGRARPTRSSAPRSSRRKSPNSSPEPGRHRTGSLVSRLDRPSNQTIRQTGRRHRGSQSLAPIGPGHGESVVNICTFQGFPDREETVKPCETWL